MKLPNINCIHYREGYCHHDSKPIKWYWPFRQTCVVIRDYSFLPHICTICEPYPRPAPPPKKP